MDVGHYIRSVRVERTETLLAFTNLSVGEIAGQLCFKFQLPFQRYISQAYRYAAAGILAGADSDLTAAYASETVQTQRQGLNVNVRKRGLAG